jgi:hypothetical protein
MKRLSIFIVTSLLSLNAFAGTDTASLGAAIHQSLHSSSESQAKGIFSFVYGGQDFSHSQVAKSDDQVNVGQQALVG